MKHTLTLLTALLLAPLSIFTYGAEPLKSVSTSSSPKTAEHPTVSLIENEVPEQRNARLAWWREAKFGMFIHWGVFSVPAGVYHEHPAPKGTIQFSEWLMFSCGIPVLEYRQYAQQFNPIRYNAEDWVKAARDAGMKYIVITTKHHDGFAMFDSKASDWNIVQASPYGKDPLKVLAQACRQHGIKLGFYYSQAQDWVNGGSIGLASMGTKAPPPWDKAQRRDMDEYINKIAVPHVREICSNYGEFPQILWWDTPRDMNRERAEQIQKVVQELRPGIIQNNRLGGGYRGDTETPEGVIPAQGYTGRDWETCMTMNDSWGYKRADDHWKSTETLIRNLCDIASKGGNYLLNVGPTSEGLIPQPSLDRLAEIGRWMRINGEAIYGTGPTLFGAEAGAFDPVKKDKKGKPLFTPSWVWRCTQKPGKLYIHIFQWPTTGKFKLPAVNGKITKTYLLADVTRKLDFQQTATGVSINLPDKVPDAIASVVCLVLTEK